MGGNLVATSNGGAVTQSSALTVSGVSNINASAGAITLTAANDFAGVVSLTGGATSVADINGITLGATNVGAFTFFSPTLGVQGAMNAAGNFNLLSGTLTISPGGSLTVSGATDIAVGGTLATGGSFSALGPVSVGGTLRGSATGPINAAGQVISVPGTLDLNGGAVTAGGVNVSGLLKGIGSITGNVNNAGTVAPGASPGIMNITGTYTQTAAGTLQIEIGGTAPGTGYDQLQVSGNANLNGAMVVTQFGTFVPAALNTFQPITAGGVIGTFANVVVPAAFAGLGATYLANSVDLTVSHAAAAGSITAVDPRIVNEDKDIFDLEEHDLFRKLGMLVCD